MSKVQTDNSFLNEKVKLRLQSLESIDKEVVKILEAFSGDGLIWDKVKEESDKNLVILKMDKKKDKKGIYLKGDNTKFLKGFDLSDFDIIDLDAYGSPYKQLKILFEKQYKGIVHCTYIQSGMGRVDDGLLIKYGYSKEMIKKCPTLLCKDGMKLMENYLGQHGIEKLTGFFYNRKRYFYFDNTLTMNNL